MKNNIKVEAHVTFLEAQSSAQSSQYAFAYTITITNKGDTGAQLLTRFWHIKDESGDMEEVVGEGVIGMQPHIAPGESFQYSSGAVIKTLTGSMYGSYGMINDDGDRFDADIPEFILTKPYTLH